jgi:formylglycine-generating enzyme required for sulfatase activity
VTSFGKQDYFVDGHSFVFLVTNLRENQFKSESLLVENIRIWDLGKVETLEMTPTPEPEIGSTRISPLDGMVQVYIPEGEFMMGSETGPPDEIPIHTVYLDAFWMDEHEVTSNQIHQFLKYQDNFAPPCGEGDNHPASCVYWNTAQAYCEWKGARLPTEAELEKAARGGLERKIYPWGNGSPICQKGAANGAQFNACSEGTVPVKTFAPNGYGLYDMAGNVWEWAADYYQEGYYRKSPTYNPQSQESDFGVTYVLRGGSFYDYRDSVRVANRGGSGSTRTYTLNFNIGFRCVVSVP